MANDKHKDALSVFSKKRGESIALCAADGAIVQNDGIFSRMSWMDGGWMNTGGWLDNGWNNTGNWMDNGWNNTGNWHDNGWNNTGSWSDSGWSNSSGGDGCYITTACVQAMGLGDDCDELMTLRRGRDALVQSDESFRAAVLDYYRKAPMIVAHIMREPRRDEILRELYETMVTPCVALLKAGKTDEAKAAYLESYRALCEQYGI